MTILEQAKELANSPLGQRALSSLIQPQAAPAQPASVAPEQDYKPLMKFALILGGVIAVILFVSKRK